MNYRPLGSTGISVSELVFGCGAVGGLMINAPETVRQDAFDLALASGINWFDTAASYGQGLSEENLGYLLAGCKSSRPHVSTKVTIDTRNTDYAAQVEASLTQSLERLQSSSVTLLQLHNPIAPATDRRTLGVTEVLKPGGVLAAMEAVRDKGLCDHIGITALGDTTSLIRVIDSGRIATAQVYYNLLNPSAGQELPDSWPHYSFSGLIDACVGNDVAPMNIRVFSAGVIATTVRHGREQPLTAGDTVVSETDKARHIFAAIDPEGNTRAQTAVRFALSEPRMACVVIGLAEQAYLEEAIAAAEQGPLPESSMSAIRTAWQTYGSEPST